MIHLQNIVGVLKRNKVIVMSNDKVLMVNYKIVEFIAIMQCVIEKFTVFF